MLYSLGQSVTCTCAYNDLNKRLWLDGHVHMVLCHSVNMIYTSHDHTDVL